MGWNLTWFCVKYFKIHWLREKNLQISQDWPLEAALDLSFHSWIKTNQIGPFTLRVVFSDHMAHFSTFTFALFWGVLTFNWWSRQNKRHLLTRKTLLSIFSSPPQSWNWLDFLDTSLIFLFHLLPAWFFISMIIMINHHIVLHYAKRGPMIIDSDIPLQPANWLRTLENLFLSKMIDLPIPVLTRDNVLSSYQKTFDWLHLDQSRLANQMYNNLPIASCCTVDIPCST